MIREHLKSTNGIYLYYYLKYIKTECTFEDVIYKMCIFFTETRLHLTFVLLNKRESVKVSVKVLLFCKQAKVHTVHIKTNYWCCNISTDCAAACSYYEGFLMMPTS